MTRRNTPQDLAQAGAQAWADAAARLHFIPADHAVWYAVLGAVDETVSNLSEVIEDIRLQASGYANGQPAGLEVYDDEGADPRRMLAHADNMLGELLGRLREAKSTTSAAWSTLGHIGVRGVTPADGETATPATSGE